MSPNQQFTTDNSQRPLQGRLTRRIALTAAILLFTVSAALAAALVGRLWIAEKIIARVAEQQNLGALSLTVSKLDLSRIVVTDISIPNDSLIIDHAEIAFSWNELLERRVRRIALTGLQAKLAYEGPALKLGDKVILEIQDNQPNPSPPFHIEHIQLIDTKVEASWNQFAFVSAFDIEATQAQAGWDTRFTGSATGMGGVLRADWVGRLNFTDLLNSVGRGTVSADVKNVTTVGELSTSGTLMTTLENGELKVEIPRALTFQIQSLPLDVLQFLPVEFAKISDDGVAINISSSDPIAAWLRRNDTGFTGGAALQGSASIGLTKLGGTLKGTGTIREDGAIDQFFVESITTELLNFPLGKALLDANLEVSSVLGPNLDTRSPATLLFTVRNLELDEVRADKVTGDVSADIVAQSSIMSLESVVGQFDLENLQVSPAISVPGITTVNIDSMGTNSPPAASFAMGGEGASKIDVNIRGEISKFTSTINAVDDRHLVEIDMPRWHLSGFFNFNSNEKSLELKLSEGAVKHDFGEADDIHLNVFLNNGMVSGAANLRIIEVGDVTIQSKAQQLDLRAFTTFQQSPNKFLVAGGLQARNKNKFAEFKAHVAQDSSRGALEFKIPHAQLGSGGAIDAAMVSAFLPITNLAGTADINVSATWNGDEVAQTGYLELRGIGLASSFGSFTGLSTSLNLDSLWPLRSKESQEITVTELDIGVPFTDLEANINWPGNGTSIVNDFFVNVAGGHLRINEAIIPFEGASEQFVVAANDIDTVFLAALADVDGLKVGGKLSGVVPIRFSDGGVKITNAKLSSTAPGFVQYQPAQPPAGFSSTGGGDLLLQALNNFKYETLDISAAGNALEEMEVSLALRGYNPDLYEGYPVAFNLKLNGEFLQLMRQGLSGYRLPEAMQQNLRKK